MRRVVHLIIFTTTFLAIRACGPEQMVNDVRRSPYHAALTSAYLKASSAARGYTDQFMTACDAATLATVNYVADARVKIKNSVATQASQLTARGRRLLGGKPEERPSEPAPPNGEDAPPRAR